MSAKPWIAWYPADYAAKTGHLSFVEDSAYRRLIDHYYMTAKPLPNDPDRLARIANAHSDNEVTAVKSVISEFFSLGSDELLHNQRIDSELIKQRTFTEEQSRKGRLSAQARWGNRNNQRIDSVTIRLQPNGNLPQPQPQPHITTTENQKQKTRAKKSNGQDEPPPDLPDWLPLTQWQAWIEARTKARHPPTNFAKRLAIIKLDGYREQGHSVAAILAKSAMNNWSDLFEPKD